MLFRILLASPHCQACATGKNPPPHVPKDSKYNEGVFLTSCQGSRPYFRGLYKVYIGVT